MGARLRDGVLVAPSLIRFELMSVCWKKCRRNPVEQQALVAALAKYDEFEIGIVAVDHTSSLEVALDTGLTAYDASYLWLARHLGAELITLDKQLERAWRPKPP